QDSTSQRQGQKNRSEAPFGLANRSAISGHENMGGGDPDQKWRQPSNRRYGDQPSPESGPRWTPSSLGKGVDLLMVQEERHDQDEAEQCRGHCQERRGQTMSRHCKEQRDDGIQAIKKPFRADRPGMDCAQMAK